MSDWKGTGFDDRLTALISEMINIGPDNDEALIPVEAKIEEVIDAIVAAEREACAKIAEAFTTYDPENWCAETSKTIANAIRARGKTE